MGTQGLAHPPLARSRPDPLTVAISLTQQEVIQLAAEVRAFTAEAAAAGTPLDADDVDSLIRAGVVFAAEAADERVLAGKQVMDTLHRQVMAASTPEEFEALQDHYRDATDRHEQELKRVIQEHDLSTVIEQVASAVQADDGDQLDRTSTNPLRPGSFYFIGLSRREAAKSPDLMQLWMKLGGAFDRDILGDRPAFKAARRRCKAIYNDNPAAPPVQDLRKRLPTSGRPRSHLLGVHRPPPIARCGHPRATRQRNRR